MHTRLVVRGGDGAAMRGGGREGRYRISAGHSLA